MLATIGIIIDIVIVLVALVLGIIGLKKGFLNSILSLFNWAVCLIIALLTAKFIAGWIDGICNLSGFIGEKITNDLKSSNDFFNQAINVYEAGGKDTLIANIPADINGLIKQLIKIVFSSSSVDFSSTDSIGQVVGDGLGYITTCVICAVLIFVILMIVVKLLMKLFDKLTRAKVIGGANKILGLIFGVLRAVIIVFSVNLIVVAMSLIPMVNNAITPLIQENTYVEKVIYNATDNLIEKTVIEGDLIKNWTTSLWENRK